MTIVYSEEDVDLLFEKGIESYRNGNHDEAISYFDRVLEIEPDNLDALTNKGGLLSALEKHEEAIPYFDRVLDIESNHVSALVNKASALGSLGEFDDAIFNLDRALEIEPKNINALTNKAAVLIDQDNYYDAISYFHKILEVDPGNEIAEEFIPLAKRYLGYSVVKGFKEFILRDHQGTLISYFKSPYLAVLDHELGWNFVNSWSVIENISFNNTDYQVKQRSYFNEFRNDTIFASTVVYYDVDPDLRLIYSPNWGFPMKKNETAVLLYTYYKPIEEELDSQNVTISEKERMSFKTSP